jgi:hypothetical protein
VGFVGGVEKGYPRSVCPEDIGLQSREQYKTFLDHVVGLADRRQSVTTTYLSVNTAITAAAAFLFRDGDLAGPVERISAMALLVAGLVASSLWRTLIGQYSLLIGWWYEQLRTLEGNMSGTGGLITKEYDRWYVKEPGKKTIGLTRYETGLTWLVATFSLCTWHASLRRIHSASSVRHPDSRRRTAFGEGSCWADSLVLTSGSPEQLERGQRAKGACRRSRSCRLRPPTVARREPAGSEKRPHPPAR